MFAGFDLKIDRRFFDLKNNLSYERYAETGKKQLEAKEKDYRKSIEEFVLENSIDGTKVQDEWFPLVNADIFISHSHKDKKLAEALAGWIYITFGNRLSCFIDANVWGYQDDLLETMNSHLSDKKIFQNKTYYNHEKCNRVAQHVNTMLSIALQKMIDKTEAVIFLNTENSVQINSGDEMNRTYSPWIYTEIVCSQIVRKKPLLAYRNYSFMHKSIYENTEMEMIYEAMINISYEVSLEHLISIDDEELILWENNYRSSSEKEYPLDSLYQIMISDVVDETKRLFLDLNPEDISLLKQIWSNEHSHDDKLREGFNSVH